MPWRLLALFLAAVLQSACFQIPDYNETGCGDSILGIGEDCDVRYAPLDGTCGEPGSEHACHYVCDSSDDSGCPPGWGCSVDGRCYRPRSQLAPRTEPVPIRVTDVIDMDADGFGDLLASDFTLATRFSDGDGGFESVFNLVIPQPSGKIWVAPLDDDALSDAIIPLGPALLVLSGQETRNFSSRLFPTLIVRQTIQEAAGVALEADRDRFDPDSELLVLSQLGPEGSPTSIMAFVDSKCSEPEVILPDSQQVSSLAGKGIPDAVTRIPRADLDGDRFTELALAFRGSSTLYLYGSAGSPGGTEPDTCLRPVPYARTPEIATPAGYVLSDQNPLFADVDGDTDLDVIIGVAPPPDVPRPPFGQPILTTAVAVAQALGDGTYEAQATIVPGLQALDGKQSPVLAAGDLDGDGVAEYVTAGGILRLLSTPALPTQVATLALPRGASWVAAEVLDLNGDDALDVVTVAPGNLDWFLNTTPVGLTGQFNRFILDGPAGAPQLHSGDFNGDLRPDIAVIARLDGMNNELVVVFGSAVGIPGEVQPVGGFGGRIHFVETGFLPELGLGVVDGLSDLFLWTSTDPPQGGQATDVAFFALHGSTAQRLLSPFFVVGEPGGNTEGSIVAVAATGNFVDAALIGEGAPITQRSVAVVSLPTTDDGPAPASEFTLLVTTRPGELRPARQREPVLPLSTFNVSCAEWLVGDVAPDEIFASDELVGIETALCEESRAPLTIAVLSVASADLQLEVDTIELPAEYGNILAQRLADVDHDGRPDLVLILARNDGSSQVVEARILWNEGCPTSRFCIGDGGSTLLPVPSDDRGRPLVGQPLDIVAMQLEDDERLELVVLYAARPEDAQSRPMLFSFADRTNARDYTTSEVTFPFELESRSPRSLAAGDVNGDGLADLVLGADPLASVLLQEPAEAEGTRLANESGEVVP